MVAASRDWMTVHAASPKARSLHQGLEQLLHGGVSRGVITGEGGTRQCVGGSVRVSGGRGLPDEGHLVLVHPGLQLQAGVLPERRDDEAEDQSDAHKDRRQHNLQRETA